MAVIMFDHTSMLPIYEVSAVPRPTFWDWALTGWRHVPLGDDAMDRGYGIASLPLSGPMATQEAAAAVMEAERSLGHGLGMIVSWHEFEGGIRLAVGGARLADIQYGGDPYWMDGSPCTPKMPKSDRGKDVVSPRPGAGVPGQAGPYYSIRGRHGMEALRAIMEKDGARNLVGELHRLMQRREVEDVGELFDAKKAGLAMGPGALVRDMKESVVHGVADNYTYHFAMTAVVYAMELERLDPSFFKERRHLMPTDEPGYERRRQEIMDYVRSLSRGQQGP